jgi:hypothetical protein
MERTGCTTIEMKGSYVNVTRNMVVGITIETTRKKVRKYVYHLVKAHKIREWIVQDETVHLKREVGAEAKTSNTKRRGRWTQSHAMIYKDQTVSQVGDAPRAPGGWRNRSTHHPC